ncbi:MAG: S9 family peptidase [Acidobacteriota bacterium]|nr:MAG: S9 family peptidase [Acidobacteriota bacterium]
MSEKQVAGYGSWKSPITSDLIVSGSIGLGQPVFSGGDILWLESRPVEKGRNVLIRQTAAGSRGDLTPLPFNVRTRVHEYGGAPFVICGDEILFSNFADQRLYRIGSDGRVSPVTPAGDLRYADGVRDRKRSRIICVREDHTTGAGEPVNTIIGLEGEGRVIIEGSDFYSSPRISPDGDRLAWLSWNHPNMPWDGTELRVARFGPDGTLEGETLVAGGPGESIFQPEWSPDGALHFISDRTGWWNLYRWSEDQVMPLCPMEADFGQPQWVFGMSTYDFISKDRIICTWLENGFSKLGMLDPGTGALERIETEYSRIEAIRASEGRAIFLAASVKSSPAIVVFDPAKIEFTSIRRSSELEIDPGYISEPRAIDFPSGRGLTSHAFFYPPRNRDFEAPEGERPPLLVMIHGGPTAAATPTLKPGIQYWTSRGFAVLDVNYGGSTGYGRAYRDRLKGQWGIVDVEDCVNGAGFLAAQGLVDGDRMAITGGSAGGYTTLCALTFHHVFKAGASHYGVSDLEALDIDTHKFEARYTQSLVGPYPASRNLYIERSPIHHTDRLSAPVIFFQGLEDKIVPPNQSEMMVDALRARGLPVAYITFEGEQHGFRQAQNIKRALDGELYFYSRIFGFEPADRIEPVEIENL